MRVETEGAATTLVLGRGERALWSSRTQDQREVDEVRTRVRERVREHFAAHAGCASVLVRAPVEAGAWTRDVFDRGPVSWPSPELPAVGSR